MPLQSPDEWDAAIDHYDAIAAPFTFRFAEDALAEFDIGSSTRVLDIATGTGAAALTAARRGAWVTAIDFSPGMVRRVAAHGLTNIKAVPMDGQALDLPDAAFDVSVSMFGIFLFPDWRAGLREMARVTRPGGTAVHAVWRDPDGAAINLLLAASRRALFPDLPRPTMPGGLYALADAGRLERAMADAGFVDVSITQVSHDFELHLSALETPERLFVLTPFWTTLEPGQRRMVLADLIERAERQRVGDVLPIPSAALIATARRP